MANKSSNCLWLLGADCTRSVNISKTGVVEIADNIKYVLGAWVFRVTQLLIQRNYALRGFGPADLDAVMNINRVCLPENYAPYFFLDTFNTLPEAFLIAESEGRVVGYIMCRLEHGFSDLRKLRFARKGHIVSVAVMPEYRNNGIGCSLVEQALSAMSARQVDECYLEVRVNNYPAINLYKKLGFEVARTIPRYYFDASDAYVMSKPLI